MLRRKKCLRLSALLSILIFKTAIAAPDEPMSSLVFAIDDTGSMTDDISAVKRCTLDIFDIVLNSKKPFIEDFVLVTFNDPDIRHRTTTKDKYLFRNKISEIRVDGGGDCPEKAMSGIELALQKSRPGSLLYVFTDASPKDSSKQSDVIRLAQKNAIKVVFVLTGKCGDRKEETYYQVARASGGQVFNLKKDKVGTVLEHVKIHVNNRQGTVAIKEFPAGTHQLQFAVDSKMKELIFSISGEDPSLKVTDPVGKTAHTTVAARTDTFTIEKITQVTPGTYTAKVTSTSRNSVVVTAETNVHFWHGFSQWVPGTLNETVPRPIPGELSYLSIKLETGGSGNVVLDAVEILDMEDKVVADIPLVVNGGNKFYTTERTIVPPSHLFRVAIKGHDTTTNEIITRISLTSIEPQSAIISSITNKAPTLTVIGEDRIDAEYDRKLLLKCKVNGYPKPTVTWQTSDGASLESTLSLIEYPDEYLSTLTIDRVTNNITYSCVAQNDQGRDSKQIQVNTVRKTYFNPVKTPERDSTIEYDKEAIFKCIIDANPPADINWYKDGVMVEEDDNIKVSSTELVIKRMRPKNAGKYMCRARNEVKRQSFHFDVRIEGVEKPVIDKSIAAIPVKDGSIIEIRCNIIQGKPKPSIVWYRKGVDGIEHKIEGAGDQDKISMRYNIRQSVDYRSVRCEAKNDLGTDYHWIQLNYEYPARILDERAEKKLASRVGERVKLECVVDGQPEPEVTWYRDGEELILNLRYSLEYRTKGINFQVVQEDAGLYTCRATNKFGSAEKTINLQVIKAPVIEAPSQTMFETMVGETVELPCRADGYPKPTVEWMFFSPDPEVKPQHLGSVDTLAMKSLQLKNDGFYRCAASNDAGTASLTYVVKVFAPPNIENTVPDKTFTAVIGDLVLKVPCKATGNPAPTITWVKEGVYKIAAGTEWYDIDDSGTLIIKNLEKESAGGYVCEARNDIGVDTETYNVVVEAFPDPEPPSKTIEVEEGKSKLLHCDVPYQPTDIIRWYKDGIEKGLVRDMIISRATLGDAGTYTCRVSTFDRSRSQTMRVVVGAAPRFRSGADELIEFGEGFPAFMDCSADGVPAPEISWWHKGRQLPVRDMTYELTMKVSNRGIYHCLVKNKFGTINRKFEISSQECLFDIEKELKRKQPLILSSTKSWPHLEVVEGNLKIEQGEPVILSCPKGFENLNKTETSAFCKQNTFTIDKNDYKLFDLQCKEKIMPIARNTKRKCVPANPDSNNIKIGYYDTSGKFLEVYDICYDTAKRVPIYAKHRIQYTLANVEPNDRDWHRSRLVSYNNDEVFDCGLQVNTISSLVSYWFHKDDQCCFSRRLLVNPRDVSPGLPQIATYNALNVVPHWSVCNSENWESIEDRVRSLASSTNEKLSVWTGAYGQLQISGQNISVYDRSSAGQAVPEYLWKVVQDPTTKSALAIIQLNVPDLTMTEARRRVLCSDICHEVEWMRNSDWHDVTKGYTFCCNAREFERAFGYRNLIGRGAEKVLYEVSLVNAYGFT